MGVNTSVQSAESLTHTINRSLTKITTEIENSSNSIQKANQVMAINLSNVTGCNLLANQTASVSANIVLENSSELSTKMSNELMNSVKKEIAFQSEQVNEDLNIGQLNTSIMNQKSMTYIENNLETLINTGIKNSVTIGQDGRQEMKFNMSNYSCPNKGGLIEFNQNMMMETISKNISKNIVDNVIKNGITNIIDEKAHLKAKQANKGIDIFAMFTVFIVIVVVGFGGFSYLRTGGTSNTVEPNKAADAVTTAPKMYGGNDNTNLKLKLAVACSAILGTGYYGYYLPEKEKIADKYDLSYLKYV
jgi:hypothetical protein